MPEGRRLQGSGPAARRRRLQPARLLVHRQGAAPQAVEARTADADRRDAASLPGAGARRGAVASKIKPLHLLTASFEARACARAPQDEGIGEWHPRSPHAEALARRASLEARTMLIQACVSRARPVSVETVRALHL